MLYVQITKKILNFKHKNITKMLIPFENPYFEPRLKKENNELYIFDEIRNKFVVLTPEEWVRQNFISFLIKKCQYPLGLFQIEKQFQYHQKNKRTDILAYNKDGNPFFLVECKAQEITLSEKVLAQALTYNHIYKATHFGITNGKEYMGYTFSEVENRYILHENIPIYA